VLCVVPYTTEAGRLGERLRDVRAAPTLVADAEPAQSKLQKREALSRPRPEEACRAWDQHLSDLIGENEGVLDFDVREAILTQLWRAQITCHEGKVGEALATYEAIPIERSPTRMLR
jgi:hypothetical protein